MKRLIVFIALASSATAVMAQSRDNFLQQQAYQEMQRVTGQMDVLQTNVNELQERVGKLERGGDTQAMRQEINTLRAEIEALRRELRSQRGEIVKDLSGRISKIQAASAPAKPVPQKVVIGPHREYVVKSGDTLSLVSQAFDVPVKKIREMNNLKSDNLRVGQKLNLPK